MTHYTIIQSMDIQGLEQTTDSSSQRVKPGLRIINRAVFYGFPYFLVQWPDPSMVPCWIMQNNEPWMQKLIQQFQTAPLQPCVPSMDVQQTEINGHLKSEPKVSLEQWASTEAKDRRKLRPEDYDKLGSEDVKAIVDKFISKIKMAIYKLKSAKGKNIYCAITKVVCLYNAGEELGLIVQQNGSDFYKFITYNEMKENHPRELQVFLQEYMQKFNNFFIKTLFDKNYRYQAHFLGQIFDNSWKKDPSGFMVKQPAQKQEKKGGKSLTLDSQASANLFSVEFDMDDLSSEPRMMMDEAEESQRKNYNWGK